MPARFKLDENLPRDAEALLREAGLDVHTVLSEQLEGNSDPRVFEASQAEDRILVTFDLDFSDIRVYPPASHKGIWILCPHAERREHISLAEVGVARTPDRAHAWSAVWVIEPERVRIRE